MVFQRPYLHISALTRRFVKAFNLKFVSSRHPYYTHLQSRSYWKAARHLGRVPLLIPVYYSSPTRETPFSSHINPMADTVSDEERFEEQLVAAVEADDLESLRTMLDQRLAEDPDAFRWGGLGDALNKALGLARYSMAEELFKRGAAWNYETMGDVLEGAQEDNDWNTKAIDLALTNGWDINEHYEHVGSALVYTVSCADEDDDEATIKVAAHLLAKGADANAGEQTGQNPLELACTAASEDMVTLLLAHGATVQQAPKALLNAADQGSVGILQTLLGRGADVNAHPYEKYTLPMHANDEGWGSALHCAVKGGHLEAVKFLLEQGADKEYRNKVGVTPLELARKLGRDEIAAYLESK